MKDLTPFLSFKNLIRFVLFLGNGSEREAVIPDCIKQRLTRKATG